jgi:hypothetical protein
MLFSEQLAAQKDKPTWAVTASVNIVNPVPDCSCITMTFTISNPEDEAINNFTLEFLPKINGYAFCENPGFVNTGTTVAGITAFNGSLAERWSMTGINVPATGTTTITARVRVVGAFSFTSPSLACRGIVGTDIGDFVILPTISPNNTFITVNGPVNLSTIATGTTGMLAAAPGNTGQDVVIDGQLTVDVDYTFSGLSRLYMRPGSSINVTADYFTLMDRTTVRACDQPWQGIDVAGGSTLILDGVNGVNGDVNIMDAEIAVEANSPISAVSSIGVKFINNAVGISSTGGTGWYFDIQDNIFTSDEFTQLNSLVGVRMVDVSEVLSLSGNLYNKLVYGVWSTNTTLNVRSDRFVTISDVGILTECNNNAFYWLRQSGLGQGVASFDDCFIGIKADNVEVGIQNNLMTRMNRGISLRRGNFKDAGIFNNTINAERLGISVNNWRPRTLFNRFRIENNLINMDGFASEGAAVWLENLTTDRNSGVINNTFNLSDARYGIYCNTVRGTMLAVNDIAMNNAQAMTGIDLNNTFSNSVYCNGTTGADINAEQEGIRVASSSNVSMNCNASDNTERAILYDGQNLPIRMISNFFNSHNRAVQYEAGTLIGVQPHHGNRWLTSLNSPDFGVWHKGNQIEILGCQIEFDGGDEPVPGQTQLRSTEEPTQMASIFDPEGGNTLSCVTNSCPPTVGSDGGLTDSGNKADALVAAGNYMPSGIYPVAQAWVAKRQLYRRLLETPGLMTPNSDYLSFYNANANTTVGKLGQIEAALDALSTIDANTQALLDANQASLDTKLGELDVLVAQYDANPTTQLASQIQTKRNEVASLQSDQKDLMQPVLSNRMSSAASWLATNNAITVVEEYEQMQQQVNAVALENIANGATELTTAQRNLLTPIANACPRLGGQAVYQARALLNDQAVYDDGVLCTQATPLKQPITKESHEMAFKLYPNPAANGYTMVEFEQNAPSNGSVILIDALGRVVLTQKFEEGDSSIALFLDGLPAGLFQLTIECGKLNSTKMLNNLK